MIDEIARAVVKPPLIVVIANRAYVLGSGPTPVEEIAALDVAAAALEAQALVRGTSDSVAPEELEHRTTLLAAAAAYRAIRKDEDGLLRDAAAGGLVAATFARALCVAAGLRCCGECQAVLSNGMLCVCALRGVADLPATPDRTIAFDRERQELVFAQHDAVTVRGLGALLLDLGITLDDCARALDAACPVSTQRIYRVMTRGAHARDGRLPKTGPNWTLAEVQVCLRAYADTSRASQIGIPAHTQPITDADVRRYVPCQWRVVTYEVREVARQDVPDFVATYPTI